MPQSKLPSQLAAILIDMEKAFRAGIYYPALLVALTLPEICVALTFDKETFVKEKHYVAFIDTYSKPAELGLNGLDCYRLRGGVIHRANASGHPKWPTSHVIFTVPETKNGIHALTITVDEKSSAMFHLELFCTAMSHAVHRWYQDHKEDQHVLANMPNLLSWRPEGLAPFVGGMPVIGSGS